MPHLIIVREAELSDLEELARLFNDYRIFYGQSDDILVSRDFLAARLKFKDSVIFLARNNSNKLLGFVQLYPVFSSILAKSAWILNDLFVLPEQRKIGVARCLLQKVLTYGLKSSAGWITLQTRYDNLPAQTLYQDIGFVRDETFFNYKYSFKTNK